MKKIKNKILIKISIILSAYLILTSYFNIIYAKYVFQNEFFIANINIDRTKPNIEFIGIDSIKPSSSNAQKTYEVSMKTKFTDQNFKNIFLDKEHIKVKQDGEYISNFDIEFNKIEDKKNEKTYEIKLKNLEVNEKFKIEIVEGTLIDEGGLENESFEVDVYLEIDNFEEEDYYELEESEEYEDEEEYNEEYEENKLLLFTV